MSKQSESVESTGAGILQESQRKAASDDAVSRRSDPWATLTAHERLLLGGDPQGDPRDTYASWGRSLTLPQVRGLVVGRALLYPFDGDVATAVDIAADLVHGGAA